MCAARVKAEFPPLLPIGRHPFTIEELRAKCVDEFPKSNTRAGIMDSLCQVVTRLESNGVMDDLWVDGSFLTKKIDPDDVDLTLQVEAAFYEAAKPETQAAIEWLNDNLYGTHKIDSYVFFVWPKGHQLYWEGEYGYVYWMKQWGWSRGDVKKGMAEIKLAGKVAASVP
jgi:hypothetical protein